MERKEIQHPAYGMARFSRVSGCPGNMFGSSVKCNNYIELEISPGEEYTPLDDIHHGYSSYGVPHIRVAFSPAQFADLLTSMNIGDGTPCTIQRINNQKVEEIPDEIHVHELDRQMQVYKNSIKDYCDELKRSQKRIEELLALPRLNKDQKEEISRILDKGITKIQSDIPFYMKQFNRATTNIVQEAKSEIDATVQHCVMNAGIQVLSEEFKTKQITKQD